MFGYDFSTWIQNKQMGEPIQIDTIQYCRPSINIPSKIQRITNKKQEITEIAAITWNQHEKQHWKKKKASIDGNNVKESQTKRESAQTLTKNINLRT